MKSIWRHVINGDQLQRAGKEANHAADLSRELGYPMFSWEGQLFRVPFADAHPLSEPLRVSTEDLE